MNEMWAERSGSECYFAATVLFWTGNGVCLLCYLLTLAKDMAEYAHVKSTKLVLKGHNKG